MSNTPAASPAPISIANESFREYVYPEGSVYRIDQPVDLYIVNGSHRVVDERGITHRPERGYVGIRWVQIDGRPFDF